jgi:hypothetical protein
MVQPPELHDRETATPRSIRGWKRPLRRAKEWNDLLGVAKPGSFKILKSGLSRITCYHIYKWLITPVTKQLSLMG